MAPPRSAALSLTLAGLAPILGGALLLVLAPSPSGSFGWFAYAPLQATRPTAAFLVLGPQQCLGAACVAVGVLVIVATTAYRWGCSRAAVR